MRLFDTHVQDFLPYGVSWTYDAHVLNQDAEEKLNFKPQGFSQNHGLAAVARCHWKPYTGGGPTRFATPGKGRASQAYGIGQTIYRSGSNMFDGPNRYFEPRHDFSMVTSISFKLNLKKHKVSTWRNVKFKHKQTSSFEIYSWFDENVHFKHLFRWLACSVSDITSRKWISPSFPLRQ